MIDLIKKLLFSFIIAAIGIGLVTGGTLAYFTDVKEKKGTFASGTFELKLNNK